MQVLQVPRRQDRPKLPSSTRVRVLVVIALIAFLALVTVSWSVVSKKSTTATKNAAPTASIPVATVTTHVVGMSSVSSEVSASGTVAAQHTVDIGTESVGLRVTEVNADEGDSVRRGQVLARLNADILYAQLSRERANLQGALANVEKARRPNRAEDIAGLQAAYHQAQASVSQADANLKRAETNLANLKATATRYDLLNSEGAVSTQEAQDRRASASMAESEVGAAKQQQSAAQFAATQAKERLNAAQAGGRQVDVSISIANVRQIQASIRQIEAQLAQTVIHAPSDGVIVKRNAEVGEIAATGQPMFTMTRDGALELRALVQEIDLPRVHAGQQVIITPASPELARVTAVVREVAPLVDAKTRFGSVYINVATSSGLKEGMYASASIMTGSRMALSVPTKAVLAQDTEKFVFLLNGNTASRRAVQTGGTSGDMVEITGGLNGGERVIVAGAGFLKDGDLVNSQNYQ